MKKFIGKNFHFKNKTLIYSDEAKGIAPRYNVSKNYIDETLLKL